MQRLVAKNLYLGDIKRLCDNKTFSVVVYKKDDRYYDMKNIYSKLDFNNPNPSFYKEIPTYNYRDDAIEHIMTESLKNYYSDGREVFDIYDLHNDMKKNEDKVKQKKL